MCLDVFTGLYVEIIQGNFQRPWKILVEWGLCIWIKIHLQAVQMSFSMNR